MHRPCLLVFALASLLLAAQSGSRVRYVGGTVAEIGNKTEARLEIESSEKLCLRTAKAAFHIDYRSINTIEYGMRVNRRYLEAIVISPLMLLSKKREHYLTIGYADADGKQQAIVLRVGSGEIRPLLVGLEARTGRRIEYQDDEARKAGKG